MEEAVLHGLKQCAWPACIQLMTHLTHTSVQNSLDVPVKATNVVHSIFGLELTNQVTCRACGHVAERCVEVPPF